LTTTHYGKTLGEIMDETISQVFNLTTQQDFYARFHCEQFTLHGDPALKYNNFQKPDYAVNESMVNVSPSFISVAESSFKVAVNLVNIGKAVNTNIVVETKRQFPDNSVVVIRRDTIPGIKYSDSLLFDVPIVATRDKGLNKIIITVDADNVVDESCETNNTVSKDVFIYEDEARPVYPYNFAIVNNPNIKFIASTANPFSTLKQYTLEIDTTELFNSPFKVTRTLSSVGGVLEFTPGVTFADSTVYYWRIAYIPSSGQPIWNSSSFIYLPHSDLGFNQSHYFQHMKSDLNGIKLYQDHSWTFDSLTQNLYIQNSIFPTGGTQMTDFSVRINGQEYLGGGCAYNGLIINVFNPLDLSYWVNNLTPTGGDYQSNPQNCGPVRQANFEYLYSDTSGRRKAMNFLNNVVPDGYYVVIRANVPPSDPSPLAYASQWMNDTTLYGHNISLYHLLKAQGFYDLDSFNRPRTWTFVYKKNGSATFQPRYMFTDGIYDKLSLDVNINTLDSTGSIESPAFGAAKQWKKLYFDGTIAPDAPGADTAKINVIGIDAQGNETTLLSDIDYTHTEYDISSINADIYPYLKLKLITKDSVNYSPYQLKYWRLTYVPVPEGAVAPNIAIQKKDTVDVGEPINFKMAFKNVSEVPFDSLLLKMVITDRNNVNTIIPLPKKRPLPVNDTINIEKVINTSSLPGKNTMYVEVNPANDQPEQYHFNNFAYLDFYVRPDSLNPLLDVTFDGVHILNNDIVSSKPHITVKLKDEAKWMILDDTSLLTLQVRYPNGSTRRFFFNNDTLRFTPAGQAPNTDNTASLDFLPYFTEDGDYELEVTGKDKSNNEAGAVDYRVGFQVINKPMISNMLNYPNPFTTSTAFVFTITGSEVPQNIRIQILTITGKIVREITKEELGPLHIGRNITEFKWDGTDQYGQKLGNGIYLYRVITNLNGKSLDKYKAEGDNTDKYFNKGYGKMYLMR
ncbi:MAG: hypothetical protein JSU05_08750, partial [Bacteroidetes bacterium]|nr:hypothetical protein [Bacteroidota bacterium]